MSADYLSDMRDERYYARRLGAKKSAAKRKRDEERAAREFARKYHSIERVWYIAEHLACCVPGCTAGPNDNAHVRTGGVGYKADYTAVAPLCTGMTGHHRQLHYMGTATFEHETGVDLEKAAADTEESWQLRGEEVVARAKSDGRFDRWLERRKGT